MKFWPFLVLIVALTLSCRGKLERADIIFTNGLIYTLDPQNNIVEAVAVKDGKILATGFGEEISKFVGDGTKTIDLQGHMMTPGFIEGHAHFMGIGYAKINLDLTGVSSYEELVEKVRQKVAESPKGAWILGRGWHQDKWDSITAPVVEGFPVHDLLSSVSPDNPVWLRHASGHAGLANARAMEIAGIKNGDTYGEGGEIIKDKKGNPTGIFNESAQWLIEKYVPQADEQRAQEAFEKAMAECLANGITGFCDAGAGQRTIDLYKKNLTANNLKLRLYVMLSGGDQKLLDQYYQGGVEAGPGHEFITIRSIKLYADGALGSRGAWLLEPYSDMPSTTGQNVTPMEEILRISNEALEHGFQVGAHAIGDRANREVLDQYEKAFKSHGGDPKSYRFRIEHAQHLHPDDIPRFGQMGVIPAMQAIHMSSDRPWAIDRLGEKRIREGAYVWRSLIDSGAMIVNGTDAPVEPVNPIACFYASVTRKTLSGYPPEGYEPEQKMTREEALRSYTVNAAYGAFWENEKGTIEKGKWADFTVFDQDLMTVPEDKILDASVLMTVVDGKIVYNAEN